MMMIHTEPDAPLAAVPAKLADAGRMLMNENGPYVARMSPFTLPLSAGWAVNPVTRSDR